MYGPQTDPTPYIAAAYAIGALCTIGYSYWLLASRRRLERYLDAMNQKDH
jgi:hypothetical protein